MNYELALKLKSAGFPQKGEGIYDCPHDYCGQADYPEGSDGCPEDCYIPTLSELIEAINPMKADEFSIGTGAIEAWEARLNYHGYFEYGVKFKDADGFTRVEITEEGSTPEETVAKLWLALNEKES